MNHQTMKLSPDMAAAQKMWADSIQRYKIDESEEALECIIDAEERVDQATAVTMGDAVTKASIFLASPCSTLDENERLVLLQALEAQVNLLTKENHGSA